MFVRGKSTPRLAEQHDQARRLRRTGLAMRPIAERLGVSLSTVHQWTADIQLTPRQIEANRRGPDGPQNPEAVARRARTWSRRCRNERLVDQSVGRARALEGDPLHLAGCMLYWAEGSKGRNRVQFTNSEIEMVTFFRRFLDDCFEVGAERLTLALNVYLNNGLTIEQIENRWLGALSLPRACLRKHSINRAPASSTGRRKRRIPYGVGTLTVRRSTPVLQQIFGAIQEYGGFDAPELVG